MKLLYPSQPRRPAPHPGNLARCLGERLARLGGRFERYKNSCHVHCTFLQVLYTATKLLNRSSIDTV
jgi:hypothetical protein